ncbi:hypothetical protein [Candidatus Bathycorpusculum sp.]|uniref:carboxypeptidase-like regulatory domain-containing protein n=1 Tax=Candidatus Bathycorpusculum sp. TaxID=2994959 RepID=UPI002832C6C3|nr:hypothetical protein [Candidatus Termitimicrobium sp.]
MKKKFIALISLILMFSAALMVPPGASQTEMGVSIYQITPSSASGPAGSIVNIRGTIYNSNSSYQIVLGKTVVASGISEGYYVDKNFTVPEISVGPYPLILQDIAANMNTTSNRFTVSMGYNISIAQPAVKEGDSITFNVSVTAGDLDVNYYAKIDIVLPSNTIYTTNVNLGTINQKGTASAQVTFPNSDFSPSGGAINYAGTYTIKFNNTLAQSQFTANILDSTVYHRGETAIIHATGYQPNQAAKITFTNGDKTIGTLSVSASADGIISNTWVIPDNVAIGSYTAEITPEGIQKTVQDQQTFIIPGHQVKIQVTNLSGRVIPDVSVKTTDTATNIVYTAVSGSDGITTLRLENGPYTITATWNEINVGEANIIIKEEEIFTLRCQLTDTTITVKNDDGITIPFVDLNITYNYQSGTISKSGNTTGKTDYTGNYILTSTLAGTTYTVQASRYDRIFNANNNTFTNHRDQAVANVVIICPTQNVSINIIGYNHKAIPEARIEFVENSNGLFYSATTDSEGNSATKITFGTYRIRVYSENALINETAIEIFGNRQQQIRCTLYGIHLSVSVVDLFGSAIPNAKVTLNGPAKVSAITQSNGIATFDNIIGGNIQIIAQPQNIAEASQAKTVNINEPTTVQVKIDKYTSFGGMLIQSSTLITSLIVLATILGFTAVEIYRHKRIRIVKHKSAT